MATTVATSGSRQRSEIIITLSRLLAKTFTSSNISKAIGVYILYIIFKYRDSTYGIKRRPELPGPKGHPIIGNTIALLRRDKLQTYQVMTENHETKFGRYYTVTLPGLGRLINISDPEMVEHVLKGNFWAYEKGPRLRKLLGPLVGQGIFGADGEHWRWQRKLTSQIFNVKSFRTYTSDVFCRESNLVIDYLSKAADTDKVVDLQNIFYLFTLDSFGEIAFGTSFGCLENPEKEVEFATSFDRLNASLMERVVLPTWRIRDWWTGNGKVVERDTKIVHDFAYGVIRKRREQITAGEKSEDNRDLMQLFMNAKDEHGEDLSDEMLKDELINMILAGRDTTAQALSWMFYLMHRSESNTEIISQLINEVDGVLGGLNPTYESTKRQKYAEACFHEALRLYPSVPQNIKTCVEDDVLPGGPRVYKGENIGWCPWAMGRLEYIWGPDAKEFKPESLGQQFATIEAITILSMLMQKFTFELVNPEQEPAYLPALTLPMLTGLPVRVKTRAQPTSV
ncbi:hypothetical protein BGZ76_006789 [Entomortierella beljakovae]|nr:hypothetical protein BGZ76_006789 [Entomortierella beljakovae]